MVAATSSLQIGVAVKLGPGVAGVWDSSVSSSRAARIALIQISQVVANMFEI